MAQLLDQEERSGAYYGILIVLSLLALFNGGINHNIVDWSYCFCVENPRGLPLESRTQIENNSTLFSISSIYIIYNLLWYNIC